MKKDGVEEEIHHKIISLYKRTGLDADTILMSHEKHQEFIYEVKDQFYPNTHPSFTGVEGEQFKGMDVFVQPGKHEEYLEVIPLKQLKDNNYV